MPRSLTHVVTAPLPHARQQVGTQVSQVLEDDQYKRMTRKLFQSHLFKQAQLYSLNIKIEDYSSVGFFYLAL